MTVYDLEYSAVLAKLLFELTQDEGNSVTVHHPSPDFGNPNSTIEISVRFGPSQQFFGDSVIDCLNQAKRYLITNSLINT